MKAITCSKCGKPIVGYYGVLNVFKKPEKVFCINCAQSTTVWDLMVDNDIDTMPDIISEDDLPPCVPKNVEKHEVEQKNFIVTENTTGIEYDAENMSWEDFSNKYCDEPDALQYFNEVHPEKVLD